MHSATRSGGQSRLRTMMALSTSVELGGGRRAAYEVIGDGPPLL